jgi:hypothetical protein
VAQTIRLQAGPIWEPQRQTSQTSSCSGLKPSAESFSQAVGALVLGDDGVEGSSAFFAGVSADELADSADGFEWGVMGYNLTQQVRLLSLSVRERGEQNGAGKFCPTSAHWVLAGSHRTPQNLTPRFC